MRVAIPTKNNRIDPQYSRAAEFTIYEIEIELVKKKEVVPLGKTAIADFLTEQDINAVICGNIRSSARNILRAKRIELTYGVLGEVDDVMIRYLSGERLGDIDENAWKAGRRRRVIYGTTGTFFPDIYVKSVFELPLEDLKKLGIRGLVFDIDNTVAPLRCSRAG